ncbi:AbfB domain-containing protein [Kibdelosporangium aridum]|uniref:AbfB domain-containing protein n=1 Tax=Kibdelosporangium aridum TaxID=2030 RepID=UPI0035EB708E
MTNRYVEITREVGRFVHSRGLSASVYTQPYDVENEINGFFTYDRRIMKMTEARVRQVNQEVLAKANGTEVGRDELISLKVTTFGLTNRYLRHQDSVTRTDVVTNTSPDLLKQDSTFWARPGLANPSCLSFESRNFPGEYLRHANSVIRKDPNDGTAAFAGNATFCARPGLGATALESHDAPGDRSSGISTRTSTWPGRAAPTRGTPRRPSPRTPRGPRRSDGGAADSRCR